MTFEIGDIVTLKSGGPKMTVWAVREDSVIDVEWFAGDLLQRDAFAPAELIASAADNPRFVTPDTFTVSNDFMAVTWSTDAKA